jgi:chromosome segregation ATPase
LVNNDTREKAQRLKFEMNSAKSILKAQKQTEKQLHKEISKTNELAKRLRERIHTIKVQNNKHYKTIQDLLSDFPVLSS